MQYRETLFALFGMKSQMEWREKETRNAIQRNTSRALWNEEPDGMERKRETDCDGAKKRDRL